MVVVVIILVAATALLVNFYNELYYTKPLLQDSGQISNLQTELGKEQYDVKLLINNSSAQVNCFNLRTIYARNICTTHNNTIKTNSVL